MPGRRKIIKSSPCKPTSSTRKNSLKRQDGDLFYEFVQTTTRAGRAKFACQKREHLNSLPASGSPSPASPSKWLKSFHDSENPPDQSDLNGLVWDFQVEREIPKRKTKTQNDFIREWLPSRDKYMAIIFKTEAQEKQGSLCEACNEAEGVI
ncbi:hypothetical protein PAXRUDRAFT_20591 [Paxillus rubicundulus Ve08.2h10]|uniref:Uncharacterized protein n=1 Tax=Paxillus rubicundulus Ve08.2h10 TaxID=930991 RepID=A0A0D0D931_9AGAM|nr:hypothetical protein PAXRUDRAFT_22097 [Paxillus rubicundulus Ve08.2h10]KIK73690.1 hypothetical protein PAXRUDRAFT_20591 [Paxillus rubicundulus Ve08.2h10]